MEICTMIYQGTAYNYNQRSEILLPTRKGTSHYGPQNHKPLIIYNGLDCDLEFFVRDTNRRPVSLHNKTFVAKVVDRISGSVRLSETLVPIDYDTGNLVMRISQDDSSGLDAGLYDIVITYTDAQSRTFGLNSDQNNRISFVLEVNDNPLPTLRESAVLNTFTISDTRYITSRTPGTASVFNRDGTNTCAVYTTGYTGVFYAQATLELNPTEADWFTIQLDPEDAEDSYTFTNTSGVTPFTWDGMFVWARFYHIPAVGNTGTLDKVLYRN